MSNLFQVQRKIRDSVILILRRLFLLDPKYPYVTTLSGEHDYDNTKIIISDVLPQDHVFYPAIVVDVITTNESRYLGPDSLGEVKNVDFEVTDSLLFASLNSSAEINVYTIDDTISRDEIVDRIYDHLKLIRDDLADNGIELKEVRFNAGTRTFADNRWFYIATLSLELYSEWVDSQDPGDLVSALDISFTLDL